MFGRDAPLAAALHAEPFATTIARWQRSNDREVVVTTVNGWEHTWPAVATEEIVATFAG